MGKKTEEEKSAKKEKKEKKEKEEKVCASAHTESHTAAQP